MKPKSARANCRSISPYCRQFVGSAETRRHVATYGANVRVDEPRTKLRPTPALLGSLRREHTRPLRLGEVVVLVLGSAINRPIRAYQEPLQSQPILNEGIVT